MKYLQLFLATTIVFLYTIYTYDLSPLYINPRELSYLRYDRLIHVIIQPFILLVLLTVYLLKPGMSRSDVPLQNLRWWLAGFLGVILPILMLIIYVNPHGILPWTHYSPYSQAAEFIPTSTRKLKMELFKNQNQESEVIILGSSRAYTISSSYLEQATGYHTFNMAVNGGGPFDFLIFAKYIYSTQKNQAPLVFLVEVVTPSLKVSDKLLPVSALPFVDTEAKMEIVNNTIRDIISVQSASDTLFEITYGRLYPKQQVISFEADGTGVRAPADEQGYRSVLENHAQNVDARESCRELSVEGSEHLVEMLELAASHKTAVVLYRSPVNDDYLDIANSDNSLYKICHALFNDYIDSILSKYPNVYFVDLTHYEPVGSLRWEGFFDVDHLKPIAAQKVIDVLAPIISEAGVWATNQRTQ